MKKSLILILFLFSLTITAQNIETLYSNDNYKFTHKARVLEFIDANMDVSSETPIAEYKLTMNKQGKGNLSETFIDFYKIAINSGANSFTIENVETEDERYIVTVATYNLNEEQMQENFSYYEDNIVVIFGELNTKKTTKPKGCKVNGKKVEILPYHYEKYQNEIGGKIKISVGGLLGSSISIKGEPNKLARCISLGGASVMPAGGFSVGSGGTAGGVGISISTGSIYPMDTCFGLFLMTILDNGDI